MPVVAPAFDIEQETALITIGEAVSGQEMFSFLGEAAERVNYQPDIRVAVLRGSGTSFCVAEDDDTPGLAATVASIAKPVIGCIHGNALGAALEIALACDLRFSAGTSRLGLTQLGRGAMPQNGGTQRLPRLVGRGKALHMLYSSQVIGAAEARTIGLLSGVFPIDRLYPEVIALAHKMAAMAPYSLRFAKEAVIKGMDLTMDQGLRLEADLYFLMQTTADRVEGITSYLKKKTPHFEGK